VARLARAAMMAVALAAPALWSPARADLASYVARPEPAYAWEQKSFTKDEDGSIQELRMVSQTWQGSPWKHRIQVFRSAKAAHPEFCLLLNTGGDGGDGDTAFGKAAAAETGCTVAFLYNIPNQPLYGKTEDALIVYTWQMYAKTGDETWPLNFPMTKAVVKAMDAVQAAAKQAKQRAIRRFAITGASKRGWTSWLTAATGDKRVVGIAPMVIDMLNMPKQLPHQLEMYGKASDQINDYSAGGILDMLNAPAGRRLVEMVDPYSYRARLTLPKLIILGTNDRYWSQDALNLYWDDLSGPKWALYTPNSGHGLQDGGRVLSTLAAYARMLASRQKWPSPVWRWEPTDKGAKIAVSGCGDGLRTARIFRAESATKDFRDSKWTSTELPVLDGAVTAEAPNPATGYAASFVEMSFMIDSKPFNLSTQMRILPAKP
jgi:PhoPQ-activated pathogenicity-related protein